MKLWQKGELKQDDKALVTEKFTVGNDRIWDMRLARFDVLGSLAHAEMLLNVNLLSADEFASIKKGLEEILTTIDAGTFILEEHSEDIHSQVEKTLTEKIGDAGKICHGFGIGGFIALKTRKTSRKAEVAPGGG